MENFSATNERLDKITDSKSHLVSFGFSVKGLLLRLALMDSCAHFSHAGLMNSKQVSSMLTRLHVPYSDLKTYMFTNQNIPHKNAQLTFRSDMVISNSFLVFDSFASRILSSFSRATVCVQTKRERAKKI